MQYWNNIYEHFDPVAFSLGSIKIHWYGIMYVLALLSALFIAKWIVKLDKLKFTSNDLDNYFIWVEVGVILGARIGYIIFYEPNLSYYLTQPWQMFNPFYNGEFVGISGMSYHGALVGFLVATFWFAKRNKQNAWSYLDLVALSVPLAYVFGRIGNFLNQELVGRATDVSWGIYVAGVLKHPSQLYEAFLEGVVVFFIIFWYRKYKKFNGELIAIYGILYSLARFVAEFYREPDTQLGFIIGFLSMGQLLSLIMIFGAVALYMYLWRTKPS